MTITIGHTFVSAKAQGADATLVSKNEWNAAHTLTQATGKLLGRTTASAGSTEEITPDSADFVFTGGALAAGPGDINVLSSDVTLSDVSTAQNIASASFTAEASSTYAFEGFYHLTRAAGTTSHTTSFGWSGTVGVGSIRYLINVSNPTGNALSAVNSIVAESASALVITAANTSATENLIIRIEGVIRTSTAGTLVPFIQYSAAPGGAPTIKANTYTRFRKLGTNSFVNGGDWA